MTDFSEAIARIKMSEGQFAILLAEKLAIRRREFRKIMATRLLQRYSLGVDSPITLTAAELGEVSDLYVDALLPVITADAVVAFSELLSRPDEQS